MFESLAFFVRRIPLQNTDDDARILDGQSKICAWAFNQLKSLADDLRAGYARLKAARQFEPERRHPELEASAAEIGQVLYTRRGLRNLLPAMKTEHPFLKSVHSSPLKNAALRLSLAIQACQNSRNGRRQGPEVQWPRFHRWGRDWFSLEYDEPGKGFSFADGRLHLSLGANVDGKRLALEIPLGETVPGLEAARNLRIVKEGQTYFAVVTLQRPMPATKPIRKVVALDPNHFLFSIANKLCKNYDLIGVGDYAPAQGDAGFGKKTNRAIQNRSLLGRFKAILLWVARRSGKVAEVFDETGTTRTCSEPDCGHVVQGGIPPSIREWTCLQCGTRHIRDENAAKNGLARILSTRSLHLPCSGPVQGRCDWRFHPSGWREVPKGSANANQTGCPDSTGAAEETVFSGPVRGVMAPDLQPAQV